MEIHTYVKGRKGKRKDNVYREDKKLDRERVNDEAYWSGTYGQHAKKINVLWNGEKTRIYYKN